MAAIEIEDVRIAGEGRGGLRFTVLRQEQKHEFLISREALDDLTQGNTHGREAEMRAAFDGHLDRIRKVAANALDYGYRQPDPQGWIVLQTKDF